MTRISNGKKDSKKIGEDLLIRCKSGAEFIMRNIGRKTISKVEGHAISGQILSVEISDIVGMEIVSIDIKKPEDSYVLDGETKLMHDDHAQEKGKENE